MKIARLVFLIFITLAVFGVALLLQRQKHSLLSLKKTSVGEKIFSQVPLNDLTRIQIIQTNRNVTLSKARGLWQVEEKFNYPASFSLIRNFLTKIWETKVVQQVPVTTNQWGQLDLSSPAHNGNATWIQLYQSDKLISSFYLGKAPSGAPGRYLRLPDRNNAVFLVNESFPELSYKLEDWLDRQFIRPGPISLLGVGNSSKTDWEITRTSETNAFAFSPPLKGLLDSVKVENLTQALGSLSFNDVLTKDAITGITEKSKWIHIKTFSAKNYLLGIGNQTNDNYFIKIVIRGQTNTLSDTEKRFEDYIYLISKAQIEPFLRPATQLLKP